uniref:Unc-50 family protein n=2 Tax=Tetraselmis sp. GSL018 TaxID=582737 RepID=A0A061QTX7_9CHLO
MLPLHKSGPGERVKRHGSGLRTFSFLPQYLRRLVKPSQMDFEYCFWLMLQLCISPKTAYKSTTYHKKTKNQWARDDPAFVCVCCILLAISASAYCITFGDGFWSSLLTMASCVFVDFLLVGCLIATAGWFISNRFLRKKQMHSHAVEQHVEWLYAFDIHCNSYFPLFILLYVCQFFASPFLLWHSFLSSVISVVLYCFSLTLYHYLTFLGYSALPFLEHTEVFLWPVGVIFFMIPFALITGFNPTRFTLDIYFG